MTTQLTEGIGPHEGNELELMLYGNKPLAMLLIIHDRTPWIKSIANNKIIYRYDDVLGGKGHYFAIPGEEWRIDKAVNIYHNAAKSAMMTNNDHIKLGTLLGYTKIDINAFIKKIL